MTAELFPKPTPDTVVALPTEGGDLEVITDADQLAEALRRRFARRPKLTADHRRELDPTTPIVLYLEGTDTRSTQR